MPSLILIKSPGMASVNQSYPLTGSSMILGRDDKLCDIVVPDNAAKASVSRKHAQIINKNSQYYVADLESRNGTLVNNQPVREPHLLKHNDCIKICDFLYRFHDEVAASRPPLPLELSSAFDRASAAAVDDSQSTIEHAFANRSSDRLLDSQPSEKLRALLEISTALSQTLEFDSLMSRIADATLGIFKQGDRCFVILQEEDALVARMVKVRRSGGVDDDQRFSRTIVRRALEKNEAYLSEDASGDSNLGAAMSIAEFRIRSVMCVPLVGSDGVPIGAIQVDTQDRTKKFRTTDLELLAIIANLASVAVEKAKLHQISLQNTRTEQDMQIAKAVQLGFLPQKPPPLQGYEFYHFYSAAKTIGGDYFDYIPLEDGRLVVVVADVAGKGVPASLVMVKLATEVRYCLRTQSDPVAAIRLLNLQLVEGIDGRFVTFTSIFLDPMRHLATFVNAGHQPPLIYRNGEFTDSVTREQTGNVLGIDPASEYFAVERSLNPGDSLILFTDGVTDALDPAGNFFSMDGISRALRGDPTLNRPTLIGEKVTKAVKQHAAGRAQNDDIALVCVGRLLDNLPSSAKDTDSQYPKV